MDSSGGCDDEGNKSDGGGGERGVITLEDLLKQVEEDSIMDTIERGQSNLGECTYPKGYLKRQGLFSCRTCMGNGCLPAVICYACAEECHSDHELYELWTKRNFRCDCGNERFPGFKCCLLPAKDGINVKNNYDNHNLLNRYCTCDRYYDEDDKTMYWCVVCEDWFHLEHLRLSEDEVVSEEDDLICPGCSGRLACVLWPYFPLYPKSNEKVVSRLFSPLRDIPSLSGPDGRPICVLAFLAHHISGNKRGNATEAGIAAALQGVFDGSKATIWTCDWRSRLCVCADCTAKYENEGVAFLVDPKDTMEYYMSVAKTDADVMRDALRGLNRTQQVEFFALLRDFRERMQAFFDDHVQSGKIITAEDVADFIARLRETDDDADNMPPDRCHDIE